MSQKTERWDELMPRIASIARRDHGQDASDAMQIAAVEWIATGDPARSDGEILNWLCTIMSRQIIRCRCREVLISEELSDYADHRPSPELQVINAQIYEYIDRRCCFQLRDAINLILTGSVSTQREAAAVVGWGENKLSRSLAELGRVISGRPVVRQRRHQVSAQW